MDKFLKQHGKDLQKMEQCECGPSGEFAPCPSCIDRINDEVFHLDIERLKQAQSDAVMTLIGGLLDAWAMVPNDERDSIKNDLPTLFKHLESIAFIMEHY